MEALGSLISVSDFQKLKNDNQFDNLVNFHQRLTHILDSYMSIEVLNTKYNETVEAVLPFNGKDLEKARNYFRAGLDCYLDANDLSELAQAAMQINVALLYVPHEGEGHHLMAELFHKRSICLSKMGEYKPALKNAEMGLSLIQTELLWIQKVYCLWSLKRFEEAIQTIDQINDTQFGSQEFKEQLSEYREVISIESQRYIPRYSAEKQKYVIADLRFNHRQCKIAGNDITGEGRHMIAIDNIAEGTAILGEKAQLSVLYDESLYFYCSYCFKDVRVTYWPCLNCIDCIFCDQNCYENARNYFHEYECGRMGFLLQRLGIEWIMTFRLIRKAAVSMNFNANNVCTYLTNYFSRNSGFFNIEEWVRNHENNYNVKEHDKDIEEKRAELDAILTFWDHKQAKRKPQISRVETLRALYLTTFIRKTGALEGLDDKNTFILFSDFLLSIKFKIQFNSFDSGSVFGVPQRMAKNMYIIGCFVNHSCDPNLDYSSLKGRLYYTAARSIRMNEDLCISYGPKKGDTFDRRQSQFKAVHYCSCLCSLCRDAVKTILSLKCRECNGPVYYSEYFPNEDCFQCGVRYDNMNEGIEEAQYLFNRFNFFVDYSKSTRYSSTTVNIATNIYLMLSNLVYAEYYKLIEIKETVESLSTMHYLSELPLFEAIDELFI